MGEEMKEIQAVTKKRKKYMKRNHIKSLRRKWRMLCNKLGNLKISMES